MATGTKTNLPKFQGKPLTESPETIHSANFLEGDFGKAVDEEVKRRYGDIPAVNVTWYKDNVVKGSNSPYVVAVNEVLREDGRGLRTATPADLEKILRCKVLSLIRHDEDSALVLRSKEGRLYEYLTRDLMKQVKTRNPKEKMPVMIPLVGLGLIKDSDSPDGFAFKLREDAEIIYAPILNEDSAYFISEDIDKETGLPTKLGKGDRYFDTGNSSLCGLGLYRNLNLVCWDGWVLSNFDSRVVVVSGFATSKNFDRYIAETKKQEKITLLD